MSPQEFFKQIQNALTEINAKLNKGEKLTEAELEILFLTAALDEEGATLGK